MRKTLSSIITGLSLMLFAISIGIMFVATTAVKNNELMYIFNISFSLIPSESMVGDQEDSLDKYDMVILKNKPFEDLEIGDVIVFQSKTYQNGTYIDFLKIHRIVGGTVEDGFITQGDNTITNPNTDQFDSGSTMIYADPAVTEDTYQGTLSTKVTFIKPLTKILIESKNIIFPVVMVILLSILLMELIHLMKEIAKEKEKKRLELHEAELQALQDKMKDELKQEIIEKEKNNP